MCVLISSAWRYLLLISSLLLLEDLVLNDKLMDYTQNSQKVVFNASKTGDIFLTNPDELENFTETSLDDAGK